MATTTAAKKPLAKRTIAATPAVKKPVAKAATKKVAATPVKKASAVKSKKSLPTTGSAAKAKPVKAATTSKSTPRKSNPKTTVSPEERYQMVAAAAYLHAEKRHFASGHALDDWIAAETDIDAMLKG